MSQVGRKIQSSSGTTRAFQTGRLRLCRTLDLVEEHLPEVDTARAREIWSLPAEPSDAPRP